MKARRRLDAWTDPSGPEQAALAHHKDREVLRCAGVGQSSSASQLRAIALYLVLVILVAIAGPITAGPSESKGIDQLPHVTLSGEVPADDILDIQQRADEIWSYLARHLDLPGHTPLPIIHFDPFDRNVQSLEWTVWQKDWTRTHPGIWRDWTALRSNQVPTEISQQWIDSNIDEIFPFPGNFLAFHYDGTNRIQINPNRTFRSSMQIDPYGVRRDLDGYGYYSTGHEMLHYALEIKGVVPTKLHHCLILYAPEEHSTQGLMEQVADYLVQNGIMAAVSRYRGLSAERALAPCETLTAEEFGQVRDFYVQLGGEQ